MKYLPRDVAYAKLARDGGSRDIVRAERLDADPLNLILKRPSPRPRVSRMAVNRLRLFRG